MKIVLDRALCDSNALCIAEAPDLFALDDDEELVVLKEEIGPDEVERARRAVSACPKAALSLQD